ncbi:methylenetetrahydrofolate reductase [Novosphingobium sp. 9]|uniref:methylenetetrahydrofolate reductase n=1 Tax=Novosphingobium sp. 9 TaxID=2025349 RepID=UPI0021B59DEA|nr:methylenetetrahydrofolate reductase [Novosphingobium sp. 9]
MFQPAPDTQTSIPLRDVTEGFSLEATAKDIASLQAATPGIPQGTTIAVPWLPGEDTAARVLAAKAVRDLGFEPMPHFSARRIASISALVDDLARFTGEAGVTECFVVAGDPSEPVGPFADSSAVIATGAFEAAGIRRLGVGGHPEGHDHMDEAQRWQVLTDKCAAIAARGMDAHIVTQFGFDAERILGWMAELRAQGITVPVGLGVPGPAGIRQLMRFAARCGVGASASVLGKYGISLGKLIGTAGPERMIDTLSAGLVPELGPVHLHFYPFGGIEKAVDWIAAHRAR